METQPLHLLARRINIREIKAIADWAAADTGNLETLFGMIRSTDDRVGRNALWCLTHCQQTDGKWLQTRQHELIDMLLAERHTGRKRMLLQLLRNQSYDADTLRTDFLDFCLSKINSECEPYAIRAFSIYCAFKMCRLYPELIAELKGCLDMLAYQSLSPGLMSALRTTRRMIAKT